MTREEYLALRGSGDNFYAIMSEYVKLFYDSSVQESKLREFYNALMYSPIHKNTAVKQVIQGMDEHFTIHKLFNKNGEFIKVY